MGWLLSRKRGSALCQTFFLRYCREKVPQIYPLFIFYYFSPVFLEQYPE